MPTGARHSRFPLLRRMAFGLTAVVLLAGLTPAASAAVQDRAAAASVALPSASSQSEDVLPSLADAALRAGAARPANVSHDPAIAAPDAGGLQPTIQYEQALAHANDRIAFKPGGRVAVPFSPRAGDRWSVGGGSPIALPGGRLDGRALRRHDAAGSGDSVGSPTRVPPDRSIDQPNDLRRGIAAIAASARIPGPGAGDGGTVTTQAAVTRTGLRREIFGFLPYWELGSSSLRLDYARISTIAYFGIGADGAGNLQKRNPNGSTTVGWSGWTSDRLTRIISTAHRNHTRVVLTVQSFGWNTSGLNRQKALLGSATARANLARQIAAAVRDRGADGVNLDFEPLARGYESEFTALVRGIRAQLNRVHRGYQLTFDTLGSIGNYPIEAATASGGADAVFVMGYDYRTASSSPVGSIAPMNRTGYDIVDTVLAYTSRISPSKVILGIPYYGRAWSTASSTVHASNTSSTRTGPSTSVTYDTAVDYLARYGRKYDQTEQVAWTAYRRRNCTSSGGCVTSWRQLYVDDATAIRRKYDLVNAYGLRGAGIWALGYDGTRPELWSAIQAKFITDSTPPAVGIRALPPTAANPGFTVAWSGTDDVGITAYDVQAAVDGGRWKPWLSATKAASAVWFGVDGHAYAFRVRARDAHGNWSAWNVSSLGAAAPARIVVGGFGTVRADGLAVRASADTSAARLGSFSKNNLVAILGGPRSADGSTWYQVAGPISEWSVIRPRFRGWVAVRTDSRTLVAPAKAPNAIRVAAALGGVTWNGGGAASLGVTAAAVGQRSFSPNGDRSKDAIRIDWTNTRTFDRLVLRVYRANGRLVGEVPVRQLAAGHRTTTWNGMVNGHRVPDGRYLVTLVGRAGGATYFNPAFGFQAASLALHGVTVDTVRPSVRVAAINGSLLSPNGDGIRDSVKVTFVAAGATGWAFGVAPVSGTRVGAPIFIRSGGGATASVTWTGRTGAGAIVPDGTYRVQAVAADVAGNRISRTWTVRVDRTPPAIAPVTPATFSPNGDGVADSARLAWTAVEPITGTAAIVRGSKVVRRWAISAKAAGAVTWTGTDAAGRRVADGTYTFRVTGRDAAGNAATKTAPVIVDRTLASLRWSAPAFFSQDGDALAPSARLSFSQSRTAVVSAAIYSRSTLVRTIWTNRTLGAGRHAWTWDGRNQKGAFTGQGGYTLRVTARSSIGTSVLTRDILVDAYAVSLSAATVKAGQTLTVTLTSVEPLAAAPTVTFKQPGRAAVKRTATALGGGRYRVAFAVARGSAGTAVVTVTGRDSRGGTNTTSRPVAVR